MVAALVFAPDAPVSEEQRAIHCLAGGYLAPLPEEGADGATEVLKLLDCVLGRSRLHKITPILQPPPALDSPVHDAREFLKQAFGQAEVFTAQKAVPEGKND